MDAGVVWHNADSGETQVWLMHDQQIASRVTVTDENGQPILVGLPWSIVGVGDSNGDGSAGIVWHNADSGETQVWLMHDQQIASRVTVTDENGQPILVGLPWSIVGVGDSNGDGSAGIVWHNADSGETQVWLMHDQQIASRVTVTDENGQPILVGLPWSIVGVGDFNGDGSAGIVWHNADSGETQVWLMHDQQIASRVTVTDENGQPILVGLPWSIVGVGDSNGDGSAGIVWHNADSGETQVWLMHDQQIASRVTVTDENGQPILVGLPWSIVGVAAGQDAASAAIFKFHTSTLGILTVGAAVGSSRATEGGGRMQRYEFGSILKPLDGPPVYATRFVVTIDFAAIKCFGTDDPGGTDEPYIVAAIYGIDPLVREHSVQTNEIHFGSIDEKSVFAMGHQLTPAPIFVPGDGNLQIVLSLWDEEVASPKALQAKWRDVATAAIIGGLTLLNPAVGAAATSLEAAKGIVTDASRDLIAAVSDFLGIADDHIATHELSISADFLRRLIADGKGLFRTSPSIPGISYNFPELPETEDAAGHSWLFEGGGGSYRIFLHVRADEITLSP